MLIIIVLVQSSMASLLDVRLGWHLCTYLIKSGRCLRPSKHRAQGLNPGRRNVKVRTVLWNSAPFECESWFKFSLGVMSTWFPIYRELWGGALWIVMYCECPCHIHVGCDVLWMSLSYPCGMRMSVSYLCGKWCILNVRVISMWDVIYSECPCHIHMGCDVLWMSV